MKDLIAKLAAKYNKPEADITESFIADLIEKGETSLTALQSDLSKEKGTVTQLTTDLTAANQKATDLEAQLGTAKTELQAAKDTNTTYLSAKRAEVVRLYNLAKGDKADAAKLALIEKATDAELDVDLKAFNGEVEEKFPASCKSCGSTEISRNTASPETGDDGKGKPGVAKSMAELNEEIRQENRGNYIFSEKSE